jgi:tetratricopeptide (TPR) repeat protein
LEKTEPDFEEAARLFSNAVELEPDNDVYWLNLGYAEYRLRNIERAYGALRKYHQTIVTHQHGFIGYIVAYAISGYMCEVGKIGSANRTEVFQAVSTLLTKQEIDKWLKRETIEKLHQFVNNEEPMR